MLIRSRHNQNHHVPSQILSHMNHTQRVNSIRRNRNRTYLIFVLFFLTSAKRCIISFRDPQLKLIVSVLFRSFRIPHFGLVISIYRIVVLFLCVFSFFSLLFGQKITTCRVKFIGFSIHQSFFFSLSDHCCYS